MQENQGGVSSKQTSAKLPKIEIERFEGSFLDWPRFWGQFTETIDKADIASINKFTYLCGLLGSKVKGVEALPFTSEGYNRAKSILQSRYGKESEIVKSQCLLRIRARNNWEIHDFLYVNLKSQCQNVSRISNQFRKIGFLLISPKQPFE